MSIETSRIEREELGELIRMLALFALPTEDVADPGRTFFRIEDGSGLLGFGGLEGSGADRLLRSLVVVPERRQRGLGAKLLAEIEGQARAGGAERLHLLTTTAAPFFAKQGYRAADRAQAPQSIRSSKEFTSLCPASASYMIKDLSEP